MEQKWDMAGGGTLTSREEGGNVRLEAVRPLDERGLYKVWLRGGQNGRCLLGTMAPEGGALRLCRTLSRQELNARGCWPLSGGESVLAFSFGGEPSRSGWESCEPGRVPLADALLRECLQRIGRALLCRREKGFLLALPFDPARPLVLAPLVCLGRVERINGGLFLVWSFGENGVPLPPHRTEETGA